MKVTIARAGGHLRIDPLIPELMEELSFFYKTRDKIKRKYYCKKTNSMKEFLVDGPVRTLKKILFRITKDEKGIITYDGLLKRVQDFLSINDYEYEIVQPDGPVYVEPKISERVFEDLYADQKVAVELALAHDGGCLIDAATSAGKTRLIASLCRAYSDFRGLVVTNRQTVAKKLYGDLLELAPECMPGIHITGQRAKGKTIVITSQSLDKFSPVDVDFILYDEVHGAASEKRSENLLKFRNSVKYGFSGTLSGGFKGVSKYLEAVFGPVVYTLTDQELEALGRASPLTVYVMKVTDGPLFSPKTQNLTMEKNGIWYNRHRNVLIKEIAPLVPANQQFVIYVRTLEHMQELMSNWIGDMGFEMYHGSLSSREKAILMEGFNTGSLKRLISTDCLAEGVDPKALFVTLNANWTQSDTSVIQKAGRNRRLAEGKEFGIVIEFDDRWDERIARKAQSRIKLYRERGHTIIEGMSPKQIEFVNYAEE